MLSISSEALHILGEKRSDSLRGFLGNKYISDIFIGSYSSDDSLDVQIVLDSKVIYQFTTSNLAELREKLWKYIDPWEDYDEWKRSTI